MTFSKPSQAQISPKQAPNCSRQGAHGVGRNGTLCSHWSLQRFKGPVHRETMEIGLS